MPPVTVYTKPGCNPCRMTKIRLADKGVPFEEVDISEDEAGFQVVHDLGFQQVPVVLVGDDDKWSGFRKERIDALAEMLVTA